jgi:hypothetical protein
MAGHFASIIDEFRQTAGRLALKHKDEKAKHKKKPEPKAEEEEAQESAVEEGNEDPGDEEAEGEPEGQEEPQEPMTHVFRRATRHARVVAHPGVGRSARPGRPRRPDGARRGGEDSGCRRRGGSMTLKPRILGPKR